MIKMIIKLIRYIFLHYGVPEIAKCGQCGINLTWKLYNKTHFTVLVLIQFPAQWKENNLNAVILLCKLPPPPHPENKSDLKHRPAVLCPFYTLQTFTAGCATPEQLDNTTAGRKIGFTGKDSLILD